MRKKEDIVTKTVVVNRVFYNKMEMLFDEFTSLNDVGRLYEFANNYWSLAYILQWYLFDVKQTPVQVKKFSLYGAQFAVN